MLIGMLFLYAFLRCLKPLDAKRTGICLDLTPDRASGERRLKVARPEQVFGAYGGVHQKSWLPRARFAGVVERLRVGFRVPGAL